MSADLPTCRDPQRLPAVEDRGQGFRSTARLESRLEPSAPPAALSWWGRDAKLAADRAGGTRRDFAVSWHRDRAFSRGASPDVVLGTVTDPFATVFAKM